MSKFIAEYTQGSGSGSGSGSDMLIPCDLSCPLPSDKPIDDYYRSSVDEYGNLILYPITAIDICCPIFAREPMVPCDPSCPLPTGLPLDNPSINSAIDEYFRSSVDINGDPILYPVSQQDICCPVVKRSEVFVEKPCHECSPLVDSSESYERTFYKEYGDGSISGDYCCNKKTSILPCDESCVEKISGEQYFEQSPCLQCIDQECVEYQGWNCRPASWEEYGALSGASPETHSIDFSAKYCAPAYVDVPCPLKLKDSSDTIDDTNIIDIPEGDVSFYRPERPYSHLIKQGSGTLVIDQNTNNIFSLRCEGGTIIINEPEAFVPVCTVFVTQDGQIVCNYGSRNWTMSSLFFDYSNNTAYTSEENLTFEGKIDIGFGRITVNKNGFPFYKKLLQLGRNGGTWDGDVGITTSASRNNIKNIGYALNSDDTITIAWAIPGDTTLDGKVDMFDIIKILTSGKYNTGLTDAEWFDGDSNYDGKVDIMDIVSILSTNEYNQGSYLPNDDTFKITWTPPAKTFGYNVKPISLTTKNNISQILTKKYDPTFSQYALERNIVCTAMEEDACKKIVGSVYNNDNIPCNDKSCNNLEIPTKNSGACCVDNACVLLKDTKTTKANERCKALQGLWFGYNTVCSDTLCENDRIIYTT